LWRKRSTKSHVADQREPSESSRDLPPTDTPDPSVLLNLTGLSLNQEIAPDILSQAYQRWLYDFVIEEIPGRTPDQPSHAMMDFVPRMFESAAEESTLKNGLRAASLLNFSSRCKFPQAEIWAKQYAGKTLKSLQTAVADGKKAASDDTLLTVYIMGMYEVCIFPMVSMVRLAFLT
jgi:hypothetical protein